MGTRNRVGGADLVADWILSFVPRRVG
jgi:hypothetical protein